MNIETIEISGIYLNSFNTDMDGIYHQKILPCLSVVQVTRGEYEVAIDHSPYNTVKPDGAFIAPCEKLQQIKHKNQGDKMSARWIYMSVTVNKVYKLEDVFSLPAILPESKNNELSFCLDGIFTAKTLCEKYSFAYKIVDLLIEVSKRKQQPETLQTKIRIFAEENYPNKVSPQDMADAIHCSLPQLFRLTKKYFGQTPANYMNFVRLQYAANMMNNTDKPIGEIATDCGFSDISYFSKLFKRLYSMSPAKYRRTL